MSDPADDRDDREQAARDAYQDALDELTPYERAEYRREQADRAARLRSRDSIAAARRRTLSRPEGDDE